MHACCKICNIQQQANTMLRHVMLRALLSRVQLSCHVRLHTHLIRSLQERVGVQLQQLLSWLHVLQSSSRLFKPHQWHLAGVDLPDRCSCCCSSAA